MFTNIQKNISRNLRGEVNMKKIYYCIVENIEVDEDLTDAEIDNLIAEMSNKKDYIIKQFILHLSEYIKHRPKLRNIISLVLKIIKIRIKLHKNHE